MSDKRTCEQLGLALRNRRKTLGLSQLQACDLAGVGPAFLYELEHGKPTVRLDKVMAVLEVLGLGLQLCEGESDFASEASQSCR
ncbi:MAG: helix-turn-helix transcriptional regulator [Planctomycetota bacterium]|nr:helix-turn-helix transcriptional regulator [Planctomycetota bacterium]